MIGAISARLVGAVMLTGFASQSAEFTQQYLQRLGGAADELAGIVTRFDEDASRQGLERMAAIERLRGNIDPFVASQGEQAEETVRRAEETASRYNELRDASAILRPFIAASNPDWTIADRTFDDFRPALPVTQDGFILTAVGFLLGWAGGASGHGAVKMVRRRGRKPGEQTGMDDRSGEPNSNGDLARKRDGPEPMPRRPAEATPEKDFL